MYKYYVGDFLFSQTYIKKVSKGSYEVKFNMNMVCMQCVCWKNDTWSSEGIQIGLNSSIEGNIHCLAYHFSMFSSSIFVPPNLLNPLDEIHLFSTIASNPVCLFMVITLFIVYFVLLHWSNIQDKKDIFMVRFRIDQTTVLLIFNHIQYPVIYINTHHILCSFRVV